MANPKMMNEFRTTIKVPESSLEINHKTPVTLIGSCFTDHIGQKLRRYKFPIDINPFGVVYNPVSVSNSLHFLANGTRFNKVDLHFFNEKWFSFYHHSNFSHSNADSALQQINERIERSGGFLHQTRVLFITLGTAWVYEHKKTGIIVSNNHKLPSTQFNRYRLSPNEVVKHLSQALLKVREVNPNLRVVFTLSPIRHWKDGATENQLSKSTLLVGIHETIQQFAHAEYFPAYEIMMDDLRDYRFYAGDMLHLSNTAIDYIWEKVKKVYIASQSERLMPKLEKVAKAMEHKPVDPQSEAHREFAQKNLARVQEMQQQYPFLDLTNEINYFKQYQQ